MAYPPYEVTIDRAADDKSWLGQVVDIHKAGRAQLVEIRTKKPLGMFKSIYALYLDGVDANFAFPTLERAILGGVVLAGAHPGRLESGTCTFTNEMHSLVEAMSRIARLCDA